MSLFSSNGIKHAADVDSSGVANVNGEPMIRRLYGAVSVIAMWNIWSRQQHQVFIAPKLHLSCVS